MLGTWPPSDPPLLQAALHVVDEPRRLPVRARTRRAVQARAAVLMHRFELHRDTDVSGISGTGVVAEGVEFTDGKVVLRWCAGEHRSTVLWDDIRSVEAIHGHGGQTRLVWID